LLLDLIQGERLELL